MALDDLMVKRTRLKGQNVQNVLWLGCCANKDRKKGNKNVDRMHNTFQYTLSLLSALISFLWFSIRCCFRNIYVFLFISSLFPHSFSLSLSITWHIARAAFTPSQFGGWWNDVKISLELHILTTQPLMSFNYFFQKDKMKENNFISLRALISLRLAI